MRMRPVTRRGAAGLLVSLFAPAAFAVEEKTAMVSIDNFTFKPARLTVDKGTRVNFVNHDDIPHLVVGSTSPPLFKSEVLDTHDSFARVFDKSGSYPYFCSLHPHMQGVIVVK